MKVLFLTIGQIQSLNQKSVHIDLIKELRASGHDVTVLCTREKRFGLPTERKLEDGVDILRLRCGNITKCSLIEKGISTLLIGKLFIKAIKKYFSNKSFDLIIYNTPPITFARTVKYCKKRYNAKSYLMLKDIFPQNAVDMGILSKSGIKGIIYKVFRYKEKQLYKISDRIGCMSEANKKYLIEHNAYLDKENIEIFPNSVFAPENTKKDKEILKKYGIPQDKIVFLYGGNLSLPQGLEFLAKGIEACKDLDCSFVISGNGARQKEIFDALKDVQNAHTFDSLPYDEYMALCASADIGMVMLDYRFTIPNYPSRILSYMEAEIPVFACTDKATDIKDLVESEAECGKWCYSNDLDCFVSNVNWFVNNQDKLKQLGINGRKYLEKHFITKINIERLESFTRS